MKVQHVARNTTPFTGLLVGLLFLWMLAAQACSDPTSANERFLEYQPPILLNTYGVLGDKVVICHVPPGNPDNAHTISVSPGALEAHLAHGDTVGACEEGGDDGGEGDDEDDGGEDGEDVVICHIPPGNPDNAHTITVSPSALAAHLAHGDAVGECQNDSEGEEEEGEEEDDDEGDDDDDEEEGGKVVICHIPPGNPNNARTISVSPSALQAHIAHGDVVGACEDDDG